MKTILEMFNGLRIPYSCSQGTALGRYRAFHFLLLWSLVAVPAGAYGQQYQQGLRDYSRDPSPDSGPKPPVQQEVGTDGIGRKLQPLGADQDAIWPTLNIPVCWENPSQQDTTERTWVQNRITATWQQNSSLQFTGWGQCGQNDGGIRIEIGNHWPRTEALGKHLDGKKSGMKLNFNWGGCPFSYQDCIEWIAAHEFGHALGFTHEQNRADAPAWCRDQEQGSDPTIYMTPYDLDSIMNYCNPDYDNFGQLSQHDIAGLQFWYSPNRTSAVPWRPSCRIDAVVFEHDNFGGNWWRIYGSMQELTIENFNDRASSVCAPAGYQVVIYEHANFEGEKLVLNGPTTVLSLSAEQMGPGANWNDHVSSLQMIDIRTRQEVYEAPPECTAFPVIYRHWHFTGDNVPVVVSVPKLGDINVNNKSLNLENAVSSLCVPAGRTVTLWEHDNYDGAHLLVTGPKFIQDLSFYSWNDNASSIEVR